MKIDSSQFILKYSLYVTCTLPRIIAGPLVVVAAYFPKVPQITRNSMRQLKLEDLEKVEECYYEYSVVQPYELNTRVRNYVISQRAAYLAAKLKFKYKLKVPIMTCSDNVGIFDEHVRRVRSDYPCAYATNLIAESVRQILFQELTVNSYPEYEWNVNKGYNTQQHIKKIIEIGPCLLHHDDFLINIPTYWSKYCIEGHIPSLSKNWLKVDPPWWSRITTSKFSSFISKEKQERIKKLQRYYKTEIHAYKSNYLQNNKQPA